MEELAGLIPVFIIALISIASSAGKNKHKQAQQQQTVWQQQQSAWQQAAPQPSAPARPASMASTLHSARPAAPAQPQQPARHAAMQPMVHTHLQPDCDTHDAPTSGSLNVVSPEGKDPCHEEQMPERRAAVQEPPVEKPGLQLDWSGDAMVKAFVMQEVLTRPCDRRR